MAPTVGGVTEAPCARPVGPEAVDEPPRRPALSPSRAADFKQCPLLYRFRAIDRLPETPSPAQVRGTLVHAVLERLFALPAAERVPAAARALVAPTWAELQEGEPGVAEALFGRGDGSDGSDGSGDPTAAAPAEPGTTEAAWLAEVDPLLDAYFALEDPRRLEPQGREERVEVELVSGLLLRGFVDRIDPEGPEPEEGYRVVDYKTGTAPGTAREARALFQMKFYALALMLLRGHPPRELRLMYLTGPETLTYVPDAEQLLRFGRMLEAMWTAIRAAGATGDFRPNPGPACAWCSHRARCPAWDGVAPPYPGWPADPTDGGADDQG